MRIVVQQFLTWVCVKFQALLPAMENGIYIICVGNDIIPRDKDSFHRSTVKDGAALFTVWESLIARGTSLTYEFSPDQANENEYHEHDE